MPPFKKMYFHLFNAITDALEKFSNQDYDPAREILIRAQQWGESMYIESGKNDTE